MLRRALKEGQLSIFPQSERISYRFVSFESLRGSRRLSHAQGGLCGPLESFPLLKSAPWSIPLKASPFSCPTGTSHLQGSVTYSLVFSKGLFMLEEEIKRRGDRDSDPGALVCTLEMDISRKCHHRFTSKTGFPGCHIYQYSNIKAGMPVFHRSIVIIFE